MTSTYLLVKRRKQRRVPTVPEYPAPSAFPLLFEELGEEVIGVREGEVVAGLEEEGGEVAGKGALVVLEDDVARGERGLGGLGSEGGRAAVLETSWAKESRRGWRWLGEVDRARARDRRGLVQRRRGRGREEGLRLRPSARSPGGPAPPREPPPGRKSSSNDRRRPLVRPFPGACAPSSPRRPTTPTRRPPPSASSPADQTPQSPPSRSGQAGRRFHRTRGPAWSRPSASESGGPLR